MKLYHVSFEPVERFIPRIPSIRANGEDCTIPRICFSEDPLFALRAIPNSGDILEFFDQERIPLTLYIYTVDTDDLELWDSYETVKQYVPDAVTNREYWVYQELSLPCTKYLVKESITQIRTDSFGNTGKLILYYYGRKQPNAKDNLRRILEHFHLSKAQGKIQEYLKKNQISVGRFLYWFSSGALWKK